MHTKPLHIQPELEQYDLTTIESRRIIRGLYRIWKFIVRLFTGFPPYYGRISIEHQLRLRESVPEIAWSHISLPPDIRMKVMNILQEELRWPNGNFIPEDPLALCLTSDYDDFDAVYFFTSLEHEFKIKYLNEEFQAMYSRWTLGDLLNDIYNRMNGQNHHATSTEPGRLPTA